MAAGVDGGQAARATSSAAASVKARTQAVAAPARQTSPPFEPGRVTERDVRDVRPRVVPPDVRADRQHASPPVPASVRKLLKPRPEAAPFAAGACSSSHGVRQRAPQHRSPAARSATGTDSPARERVPGRDRQEAQLLHQHRAG